MGYTIVYPTGDDYGLYLAKKVQTYFSRKSNVTLNIVDDSTKETQKEVLIGNTNRYKTSLTEQEYSVTLKNEKLVFEAGHQATLEKAVTLFTAQNFVNNTVNEIKGVATNFESTRTLDGKTYSYVWGDEFDGTILNTDKFTYGYTGLPDAHNYAGTYTQYKVDAEGYNTEYAKVANGAYTFRAEMDSKGNVKNSDGLCTADTMWYKYGYAEMRAKIPLQKGAWPAWWATDFCGGINNYPFDKDDFSFVNRKYMVEVDMFEAFAAEDGNISATLHKWYDNNSTKAIVNAGKPNSLYTTKKFLSDELAPNALEQSKAYSISEKDSYHTFGFLWTSDKMEMYVDGVRYASYNLNNRYLIDSYTDNSGFQNPLHMIFDNWLFLKGVTGGRDESDYADYEDFPIEYSIDYIRLYQTSGDTLYNFGLEKSLEN